MAAKRKYTRRKKSEKTSIKKRNTKKVSSETQRQYLKVLFKNFYKKYLKTKKRTVVIIILFFVALLVFNKATKEPTGITSNTVVRKTLKQTISANGKVKAKVFADLKFAAPAKIAWIGVEKGEQVKKGQNLAKLDTISLNANYQKTLNDYRNATANVELILDSIQGHETDETYAQRALRTDAEVKRDNAYEAVVTARDGLTKANIYSPIEGTVTTTNDLISGYTLSGSDIENKYIEVVDLTSMYFSVDLDELDYQKVIEGQKVEVNIDAYPNYTCNGVVGFKGKAGEETLGGVITIPVEVKLTRCYVDLIMGFNGSASFITQEKVNVLVIEKKYLVNDGDKYKVWLQKGKSTKSRELIEVEVGMETSNEVEIMSGLQEGDKVIYIPQT